MAALDFRSRSLKRSLADRLRSTMRPRRTAANWRERCSRVDKLGVTGSSPFRPKRPSRCFSCKQAQTRIAASFAPHPAVCAIGDAVAVLARIVPPTGSPTEKLSWRATEGTWAQGGNPAVVHARRPQGVRRMRRRVRRLDGGLPPVPGGGSRRGGSDSASRAARAARAWSGQGAPGARKPWKFGVERQKPPSAACRGLPRFEGARAEPLARSASR